MKARILKSTIPALATQDGAGVKLQRSLGQHERSRFDPFLMLDFFSSDSPDDYIAGFPPHPHRGFETVTYMLDGSMIHKDHMGNEGELRPGGVQWMTAGKGVIHEERPAMKDGLLRGFQLWVNLPASDKMKPAFYQNIEPEEVPEIELDNGGRIRLITGQLSVGDSNYKGVVSDIAVNPLYADVSLPANTSVTLPVKQGHNAFLYVFEGGGMIDGDTLTNAGAHLLSDGDEVIVHAGEDGLRTLLIAGLPLNEPVAQYGPFVMNTQQEVEQAMQDYRDGVLTD